RLTIRLSDNPAITHTAIDIWGLTGGKMIIQCTDGNNKLLWSYDTVSQKHIMNMTFIKDGTQQKIITALASALTQATSQILLSDNVNGVSDIGSMTGREC
ncbi:hypothetical protein, partial [Escherichia coli]